MPYFMNASIMHLAQIFVSAEIIGCCVHCAIKCLEIELVSTFLDVTAGRPTGGKIQ